jgi:hypothetical protein
VLRPAALAVILLAACEGERVVGEAPDGGPPALPTSEELYGLGRVWDLEIRLSPASLAGLAAAPRTYVPANVIFEGRTWERVGVRLKGTYSFEGLGGKPAWKLSFDETVKGQRFLGLEGLTLNNLVQDRAFVHEALGYRIFAATGVAAPRAGYVRLMVNGVLYGLYANVESVDDPFLERHFTDPSGPLYEGALIDLRGTDVARFDLDEGEDPGQLALSRLIEQMEQGGDAILVDETSPFDLDGFLHFVAVEGAIGHWDGYWKSHNYRIYLDPSSELWSFIPWGIDQTFERSLDPFSGKGLLTQRCLAQPACRVRYAEIGLAVADLLEVTPTLDTIAALIDASLDEDPRKPYGAAKVRRHQAQVRDLIAGRADALRARFRCTRDGVELDEDGDGFGACMADCDDSTGDARPGGVEVCDDLDNDCDGQVDELDSCPCEAMELGGHQLLLCDDPLPWGRARQRCAGQGGRLARLDAETGAALLPLARQRRPGPWYHAATDGAAEGTWVWDDGTAIDAPPWASDEPDDFGEEDCGVLDGYDAAGGWSDVNCNTSLPFVCEVLL